jgi:hypothetical protein
MNTENNATVFGSSVKKNVRPSNPNNYRHTKANGSYWATIVSAGLIVIGFGKVVVDAWLDFFHKPVADSKPGRPNINSRGGDRGYQK